MTSTDAPYALAVDDDPIILMDVCDILGDAGFRCHSADTGDDALDVLADRAREFTLLFSDVDMPGATDGFALARDVAQRWPWIEIVISSGRVKPSDGDLPDGATFIGKPFSAQLVHDHLRKKLPDGKKPEPLKNPA